MVFGMGLALLLIRGLNYRSEFSGGTLFQIQTQAGDDVPAGLRSGLETQGRPGAEIQSFGGPGEYVIRARLADAAPDDTEATTAVMRRALDQVLGAGQ